jgi:hypothetical protein
MLLRAVFYSSASAFQDLLARPGTAREMIRLITAFHEVGFSRKGTIDDSVNNIIIVKLGCKSMSVLFFWNAIWFQIGEC